MHNLTQPNSCGYFDRCVVNFRLCGLLFYELTSHYMKRLQVTHFDCIIYTSVHHPKAERECKLLLFYGSKRNFLNCLASMDVVPKKSLLSFISSQNTNSQIRVSRCICVKAESFSHKKRGFLFSICFEIVDDVICDVEQMQRHRLGSDSGQLSF